MSLFSLNRKACGFVTFFTAMLAAEMSQAGLVVYTSEAAWLNAVNGVQVEDFSLSPQGKLAKGPTDIGLFDITLSGVNECPNPVVDCGESFVKIAKKDSNEVLKADIDDAAITSMEFSNFGSVTRLCRGLVIHLLWRWTDDDDRWSNRDIQRTRPPASNETVVNATSDTTPRNSKDVMSLTL